MMQMPEGFIRIWNEITAYASSLPSDDPNIMNAEFIQTISQVDKMKMLELIKEMAGALQKANEIIESEFGKQKQNDNYLKYSGFEVLEKFRSWK